MAASFLALFNDITAPQCHQVLMKDVDRQIIMYVSMYVHVSFISAALPI